MIPPHSPGTMGGLASQMGSMALGSDGNIPGRPGKKKNRHAYHNLEQSAGSSQAFNGIPQGQSSPSQFLDQSNRPQAYASQQVTPVMSAFPAPSSATYLSKSRSGTSGGAAMDVSSGQGRVDPEQIPSVPKSRDIAAQYFLNETYRTMESHLPPPSTIPFVAIDQGNSSPKYGRLTLNNIPTTAEALASTALPLGLVLQPLAPLGPGESPIPVLDFGETGPPRCRRCRTYINPFMTFRSGGNKFVCNMCTFPNDVPPEYFAPTDPNGIRVDREQRPELKLGTVEFMVPKEYWAKEPVGLRHLFVIDVGQEAINRGFLESFCDGILGALYSGEDSGDSGEGDQSLEGIRAIPVGAKVGFVTFDKDIHFYNCNVSRVHEGCDQAHIFRLRLTNHKCSSCQISRILLSPLAAMDCLLTHTNRSLSCHQKSYECMIDQLCRSVITSLLTQLPKLFSDIKNPEPALLPTLDAAMDALSATGGKVICSLSALPTWGPGRLFMRDDNKLHGIETEKKLFQTEHAGWKRVASKMVESGIGVDFFIAAPGGVYMDIATIGKIPPDSL